MTTSPSSTDTLTDREAIFEEALLAFLSDHRSQLTTLEGQPEKVTTKLFDGYAKVLPNLNPTKFATATQQTSLTPLAIDARNLDREDLAIGIIEKVTNLDPTEFTTATQTTGLAWLTFLARDLDRKDLAIAIIEKVTNLNPTEFTTATQQTDLAWLTDLALDLDRKDLADVIKAWDPKDHKPFLKAQINEADPELSAISLARQLAR